MCGIGGFSLTAESKINPRALSNALLTVLEDRGYMASGFAFHTRDGISGSFKSDKPGSSLSLKAMPKTANSVIVHTRLATHGSTADNRNNHPVKSPDDSIALVHNGVIYNHDIVRTQLKHKLPEVDTSVIPALLQDGGLSRLDALDGDAAIAWLDRKDHGRLHLARLEHSPLVVCQLEDGSFVFASTEALLWRVLVQLDLMPEFIQNVKEYTYFTIRDGIILSMEDAPKSTAVSTRYDYTYYRHQTAGGTGKQTAYGYDTYNEFGDPWVDNAALSDDEAWDDWYSYEAKVTNEWEGKGTSCAIPDQDDDEADASDAWYIQYKSYVHTSPHYMYYHSDEYDQFRSELWLLQNDHDLDYTLIDYGAVTIDGLLVSQVAKETDTPAVLLAEEV